MNRNKQKIRRQIRTRAKIKGTGARPRLSVFKSNRFVYAQLINDEASETIVGVSEKHLKEEVIAGKIAKAKAVGILLAKKAKEKKVKKVVFDKGSYLYHGRISGIAQGAREGGLEF
ncbi:MAG: 50S ribosomal protein L18 [Candidatus Levybacteria bacterium RIFCSPHIGHO2_02_FULL_37_10]|nr:MAG: 50S ribosomal protein L18 [Candidatus Levybacteria bacterium RIFCSPHIGHO2_02_FULL_37_10]